MASCTELFTFAANTFLARPSEILLATSNAVLPTGYSRCEPSGRVTLIIPSIIDYKSSEIRVEINL
jgi:hypothetical protein